MLSTVHTRRTSSFEDPRRRAQLARQLLIYDQTIIPTDDFGIVGALVQWLGLRNLEDALETEALAFIHRRGLLGYGGNGAALVAFTVQPPAEAKGAYRHWSQAALFGDTAMAIDLQLQHVAPTVQASQRARLVEAILARTRVAHLDRDMASWNLAHETYTDVMQSAELQASLRKLAERIGHVANKIDLQRLPGIGRNQLQVAAEGALQNCAGLVLRVAETNMEIVMSALAHGADIHVSEGAESLIRRKLLTGGPYEVPEAFGRILDLNGIPDVGDAVAFGAVTLTDVWKLRGRAVSCEFRKWLRSADVADARDLERLYLRSLDGSGLESFPGRLLRFALTAIVGVLATVPGVAAAGLDSFFVTRYLAGFRPKLMIDRLRKLTLG